MKLLIATLAVVTLVTLVESGAVVKNGAFCGGQFCHLNAECIDNACVCGSGFIGDGLHCTVVHISAVLLPPSCPSGTYDPLHDRESSIRTCEELNYDNLRGFTEVCGDTNHNDPQYNGVGAGDGSCYSSGNWSNADLHCNSFGARLCTITEVVSHETSDSGCNHDFVHIWSSTPCSIPGTGAAGFYTSLGDPETNDHPECRDMRLTADFRCCADTEESKRCKDCPVGYYCPDPSGEPIQCPTGFSTAGVNATSQSECTVCASGYVSIGPGVCVDEDECNGEGSGHECDAVSGTCVNTGGSYFCTCPGEFEIVVDGVCTSTYNTSFLSCSENGFEDNGRGDPNICGDSDPGGVPCSGSNTWQDSQDRCGALGGRLCSLSEAIANEAENTGCTYDDNQLWTSTECGVDSYWRIRGDVRSGDSPTCEDMTDTRRSRCCANTLTTTTENIRNDMTYRRYSLSPSTSAKSCSELGWTATGSTCGESEVWGSCSYNEDRTWIHAAYLCAVKGARLCTEDEVQNGASCGTGCNFDSTFVWTSSACDTDGISGNEFWSHRDGCNSEGVVASDPVCQSADSTLNVRCCADVF